jgi:hypothetical protein
MGHQVGQLGGALGQQLSLEETRVYLTKSETHGMYFSCRNPFSARHLTGGNKKPWLFETLVYNLPRELERGSDFLTYTASNPLKRLDSEK